MLVGVYTSVLTKFLHSCTVFNDSRGVVSEYIDYIEYVLSTLDSGEDESFRKDDSSKEHRSLDNDRCPSANKIMQATKTTTTVSVTLEAARMIRREAFMIKGNTAQLFLKIENR